MRICRGTPSRRLRPGLRTASEPISSNSPSRARPNPPERTQMIIAGRQHGTERALDDASTDAPRSPGSPPAVLRQSGTDADPEIRAAARHHSGSSCILAPDRAWPFMTSCCLTSCPTARPRWSPRSSSTPPLRPVPSRWQISVLWSSVGIRGNSCQSEKSHVYSASYGSAYTTGRYPVFVPEAGEFHLLSTTDHSRPFRGVSGLRRK